MTGPTPAGPVTYADIRRRLAAISSRLDEQAAVAVDLAEGAATERRDDHGDR